MFQFLIGTVKTIDARLYIWSERLFQFLIGTVKTRRLESQLPRLCTVSIPHRYCKNLDGYIIILNTILEFQFLIGTVKTEECFCPASKRSKFQFLIGTVKTYLHNWLKRYNFQFQFLIGTVKTDFKGNTNCLLYAVSIPHRYCKNPLFLEPSLAWSLVSIPHRYCKNSLIKGTFGQAISSFNSSQVL